ncbi:hypothetical protein KGF51_10595 [Clostridioides sp. ZZV14-6045]|uniref:hypothetical protein n=1 Tax=unclassified Clostridioides TaxID=2635829 RepID=UPI001C1477CE|nr:hypothetical protein [Clostridioides sp. ZZV14-6045]MCC0730030.1 hypothetical protein [Clostridioides sp. ZZV14-6048]MCC0741745.1 hypothetical protein [Clostridioides sp. ZZV14-6044]HBF7091374.1 hypothetical protein [Clostridioides difficile]HBY3283448.1 hypothetical protein [Clostridioides difficile]
MDLVEVRKVSLEFRRLSSNLLRTKLDDKNLHLIRLADYINRTRIIKDIIEEKIKDVDSDTVFIKMEKGYYSEISIPIQEEKHIKEVYDYLNNVTKEQVDLLKIASTFRFGISRSYDDTIQKYLSIVFSPLIDFIIEELSKKIIELEGEQSMGNSITNHINNLTGTLNNVAEGNIISENNVSINNTEDIKKKISEIKENINSDNIDGDTKIDIIDDIEIIEEQMEKDIPKITRLKKVLDNINDFISDSSLKGTLTMANLVLLGEQINKFIKLFPN